MQVVRNKNTAYALNWEFGKDPNLRHRIAEIINPDLSVDAYRDFSKMSLVDIAEIETGALREYKKKPKLAIERPQLLKHMKQASGVLQDDGPREPKINIESLTIMRDFIGQAGRPDDEPIGITPDKAIIKETD